METTMEGLGFSGFREVQGRRFRVQVILMHPDHI